MSKQIRPVSSLSQLLKNVYVNAPNNHFPGSNHVLPIIILNSTTRVIDDTEQSLSRNTNTYQDVFSDMGDGLAPQLLGPHGLEHCRWIESKLAFFYQFKDNHIYNFDYEGTFIDEIMDNKCILEMC